MNKQEQEDQAPLPRKPWAAPQIVVVDIAKMTEHMYNPGDDGSGPSTIS